MLLRHVHTSAALGRALSRSLTTLAVASALTVAGACAKAPAPPPATPADVASPAPAPAPAANPTAPAAPAANPAANPTVAPAPQPTAPAPVASPAEPDDKTLERTPGLTPPHATVIAKAPVAKAGLAGTPGDSPAMGATDEAALVKVFVFSDFQCPVCRRAVEPLKKLVRAHPEVQVVFKQHPLAMHARAMPAARAAMAAFTLGKFWEMHDRLFDAQGQLDDATFEAHAQAIGFDLAAFKAALGEDPVNGAIAKRIAYDTAQADALELGGTPAFVINGEKNMGWGSYLGIESQVVRALDDAKKLVAAGTPVSEVAKKATAARDAAIAEVLFGP